MDVTEKIRRPLADEHVIGTDPPLRPELPGVWRRRINPFAGRAVSDRALTAEQDLRSGMQRLAGLALTPGSVEGLEILPDARTVGTGLEDATFQVAPGSGIARSGEDVSVGALRRLRFAELPVVLRTDHADRLAGEGAPQPDAPAPSRTEAIEARGMAARLRPVRPRRLGPALGEVAANPESAALPHVGVLVAQPVTTTILGRPVDACPPDPRDDPYADLQRIDGCQIVFYLWPGEVTALDGGPDYALPAADAALRNRLAYSVFDNEKLFLADEMHPWEAWGVPLAVAAFDAQWRLAFVDRYAVARIGGTPRARTPMVPLSGDARLWQARIDQFVGQLADLPAMDERTLRAAFVRMPPAGVLPPDIFDPMLRRQHFFPGSFGVSAVPLPRSNLQLAVREAASLGSFNRSIPDRVELLVPVPDALYDPSLLEVAVEDPRFAEAIADFRKDRANWLTRRESGRRRYDRLMESVSGLVTGWPVSDLPIEENSPAPRVEVPVEMTRTRRFNEQSAARSHFMVGANATMPVAKGDTLWLWLRIHSATKLTGLSLRLGSKAQQGTFSAGVYWGVQDAMPLAADMTGVQDRKAGELPQAGVWHRLEIPASAKWNVAGHPLDGFLVSSVEFTQRGGEVEWGSFGKTDANGRNYTYIGDDAPAGATLTVSGQPGTGWPWQPVPGREELAVPEFGTVRTAGVRRVAALDGFRSQWPQDFLAADMARIDEDGLAAFLDSVEGELKVTNDAVDLGFVRARSDIYRVRQIMLGADSASRLVTSPALADVSIRDEGARATSKGISEFLDAARNASVASASARSVPAPPAPPPAPVQPMNMGFSSAFMTLNVSAVSSAMSSPMMMMAAPAMTAGTVSTFAASAASAPAMPAASTFAAATPMMATALPMMIQPLTMQPAISLNVARMGFDEIRYRPSDIRLQSPVAGLVERTVTIAERLTPSPAWQALSYAIATKASIVRTLMSLAPNDPTKPNGIALGDLLLVGFRHKTKRESDAGYVPTLALFIADRAKATPEYVDSDELPAGKHESDYFTATVQAIDNSVAIMRQVEGRIALFEQLRKSICDLRDEILRLANEAAAWLRSVDVEVEEARHDLSVAERLRAEERARIEATNARRAFILANHVDAIAWRRVREAEHRRPAPVMEMGSGLAEDPVVACKREHEDVADEIEDYVELLRDAPVRWFPRLAAEVGRIQRLDAARAAIEAMRYRAMMPLRLFAPSPAPPKFLLGVHRALSVQRRLVEERRITITQMNLAILPTLSLAQTHVQIRQMATIGDLLDGRHRQPALTRMASEEIDGIEQIAGCLHEGFGEVAPIVRLAWAEDLSEFDRPAPLHSLAGLPGWAEVPMELRRTLQGFVDWLFGRIDRNDQQARDAVNELVRICLLMAAHAPVDGVIPARLVAPAPAQVGGRFQLALDISRIRKGMTALIRDRDERIVSRAVIEDIIDGHASAVIVQNLAAITTVSSDMRFELIRGKG